MWLTKKLIVTALLVVVLAGSMMGAACSSAEDVEEEVADVSQGGGSGGVMALGMGLSDDLLVLVAEILDIDQQDLADAFEQAQGEMIEDMPEDMLPPEGTSPEDTPRDGEPLGDMPEDTQPPEDMSPEDVPEDGMLPGDMSQGGMPSGIGLSEELLARVAELLDIDQQKLVDALEQAQEEMAGEVISPGLAQ